VGILVKVAHVVVNVVSHLILFAVCHVVLGGLTMLVLERGHFVVLISVMGIVMTKLIVSVNFRAVVTNLMKGW